MSKIRIRVGNIEIEFEGSEEFIREQIPEILQDVAEIGTIPLGKEQEEIADELPQEEHDKFANLSTTTIARKLGAKTGKDLAIAASAYLTFVENEPAFHRRKILEAMKSATPYYQQNYSKNLSRYFQQLVKDGTLNITASGTYALSAKARKDLEQKIVG